MIFKEYEGRVQAELDTIGSTQSIRNSLHVKFKKM